MKAALGSLTGLLLIAHCALGLAPAHPANTWTSTRQVRTLCSWRGAVWAATPGGLLRVEPATLRATKYTAPAVLPETDVLSAQPWGDRLVLVTRRGVHLFDGAHCEALPALPEFDPAHPPEVVATPAGLFAASSSRLFRIARAAEPGSRAASGASVDASMDWPEFGLPSQFAAHLNHAPRTVARSPDLGRAPGPRVPTRLRSRGSRFWASTREKGSETASPGPAGDPVRAGPTEVGTPGKGWSRFPNTAGWESALEGGRKPVAALLGELGWSPVITPEPVRVLAGGDDGTLLLAGEHSLWSSTDGTSWQRGPDAPPGVPIALAASRNRWVAASREALFVQDGPRWRRWGLESFPGATHLAGLHPVGGRLLVLVHGSGVWTLDPARPEQAPRRHPAGAPGVRDALGLKDELWLATTDGVVRWSRKGARTVAAPDELPAHACVALARFQGAVWLATQEGGLARFAGGRWQPEAGPSRSHVLQLAALGDRLWARHPDGSLSYLEGGAWHSFQPAPDDRLKWTSSLSLTAGGLWIGTWAGASHWRYETSNDERRMTNTRGVTALSGPFLRQDSTLALRRVEDCFPVAALEGEPVTAVVEHGGELWLGTGRRGIAVRNASGEWRTYHEGNGLPDGWVTALASDGQRLWAGTFNGGLVSFADGRWTLHQPVPGPAGRKVTCLAVDARGTLWAGTRGGLARFRDGRWECLLAGEIQCLLADGAAVWVGTRTGLMRFESETAVSLSNPGTKG